MNVKNKIELYNEIESFKNIFKEIESIKFKKSEERKKFNDLKINLDSWSQRLKDKRFKVALVGTTSAGKSTFANALLHKDLLPEAQKTCTFTSASIESSSEDKATVEFYTKDEFIDKFNNLLEEMDIESEDYYSISEYKLNELLKDKKEYIKNHPNVKEIKSILANKIELEKLLDNDLLIFREVSKENITEYITNPITARAVKRINIKSTQFKDMDDLIIYDVPGFNSPTKLHREQAEKFMKDSEIIVFVHGYGKESDFDDSAINMLLTTKDEFGTELAKKMIVVGNKIDTQIHTSKEESLKNIKIVTNDTISDLKSYSIYKKENFIPTSAQGYMQEHNLVNSKNSYNSLKQFGFSNNIDRFKIRLKEVFETDALEVLNTVVEKVLSEAKTFLLDFKLNYNPKQDEKKKRSEEFKLIDTKWAEIKKQIKNKLKDYKQDLDNKNFNLDESIKDQVENNWIDELKNKIETLVNDAQSNIVTGRANIEQASKINDIVRENIYKESLKNIVNISTKAIDEKNNIENKKLFENLKTVLLGNIHSKEIDIELNNILDSIIKDFKYESKSYKPLILRFLNDIFESLLLNKLTNIKNDSRIKRFEISRPNIEGLLYINDMYDDLKTTYEQGLIQKILIQNSNIKLSGNNDFDELLTHVKVATTKEEVVKEIETDLENLKEIFNNIILKAIKIESPFKDSLNDQVQAILNDIGEDSESRLRELLILHIESIAREEYQDLTIDKELSEKLTNIISKIDELNN